MVFVVVLLAFRVLSAIASAANVTDFQATYPGLCDLGDRALQCRAAMVHTHARSM